VQGGKGTAVILKPISKLLRRLLRLNARPQADETAEIVARLERKVLALVDNMPALPGTATQALALANDPNCKFADLARLIERDTAITTRLLRIANSALCTGGTTTRGDRHDNGLACCAVGEERLATLRRSVFAETLLRSVANRHVQTQSARIGRLP
jgi:hypothetical protein